MTATPQVSAVLVAYGQGAMLARAVASVLASREVVPEIILVNNLPSDAAPRRLAEETGSKLIETGANVGFCRAVNMALAQTSAPYVLLLNPDAWVEPDYVQVLVGHLDRDDSIASVGGKVLRASPDGEPTKRLDSLGLAMRRGRRPTDIGHDEPDYPDYGGTEEVFGITGAAVLLRRSALDQVAVTGQVLPEDFFMYLDDVDLAWRLRLAAYRSVADYSVVAWHARSLAGSHTPDSAYVLQRKFRSLARRVSRPRYIRTLSWTNRLLMLIRNDESAALPSTAAILGVEPIAETVEALIRPDIALAARARLLRYMHGALRQRRLIQARRRVTAREMRHWLA